MMFDFMYPFINRENAIYIDEDSKQKIIHILNKKIDSQNIKHTVSYNDEEGLILLDNRPFMLMRGWGYLTGVGGCNLPEDKAIETQRSLAEYIVERLNKK